MRKPGFGQRPFGARPGGGKSGGGGRPFTGKRPGAGAGGGKDRSEGRSEGDRKPRFSGGGAGSGSGGGFKPRDGKRPFKRDGERSEGRGEARGEGRGGARGDGRGEARGDGRGEARGDGRGEARGDGRNDGRSASGKPKTFFRRGEDRGEYSSRPPREGDFKKRSFRKEGGARGDDRGAGSGGRFEGKGPYKGPPRDRAAGDGERRGDGPKREGWKPREGFRSREGFAPRDRAAGDGERRGDGPKREGSKPREGFRSREGFAPRDRAAGDGERRGDGPKREGWKPREGFRSREGFAPRDRATGDGERRGDGPKREGWKPREGFTPRDRSAPRDRDDRAGGESRFTKRPYEGGKRSFDDRGKGGDRPPRRDDLGPRPERGSDFRDRGDRGSRERPIVGTLRPDRDEQSQQAASRGGHRAHGGKRDHDKARDAEKAGPVVLEPMRIAKAIARAGLCSRREAERWITDGRVNVNGQPLTTAAYDVKPKDRVLVDGKPLPAAEPPQLWRYNKPKGLVTTHYDPEGRPTVFDNLPPELPRVVSVGRLDFNTEGLILLTNDGELARHLELPATGWLRRYRVRAKGRVTQEQLNALKEGIEVDGVRYGPIEAALDSEQGANVWLSIGIREGKNREVRKVLGSLGLEVNRLIRISFGPFQLLDLKPGDVERVRRRVLFDQLGPQLAAELGIEMPEAVAVKPQKQKPQKPKAEPKADEPEWQLLEDTDIDLEALTADDDVEADDDADEEIDVEDADVETGTPDESEAK